MHISVSDVTIMTGLQDGKVSVCSIKKSPRGGGGESTSEDIWGGGGGGGAYSEQYSILKG